MTWVSVKSSTFFEEFCKGNIDTLEGKIEEYELIFASDSLAIKPPPNLLDRLWNRHIDRSLTANAKRIDDLAEEKLKQLSQPSVQGPERIITICHAASRTCLMIARRVTNQHKELYESLEGHGLDFLELSGKNAVRFACENGNLRTALQLINRGADVHEAQGHWDALLELAFESSHFVLCRTLIALGAKPNGCFKEVSLLFDAINEDQEFVAVQLVEAGANLQKQKGGKYPLQLAAAKGFCNLIRAMIRAGVDVSQTDRLGNTALHEACRYGHADVAQLLLEHHVDVSKVNQEKDPVTRNVRQGQAAFCLVGANRQESARFYSKVLAAYHIPEAILARDGIEAYLHECRLKPETLIHRQENPFELALLFQDRALAEAIVRQMSLSDFFESVKRLRLQYPTSNLSLIEFCHLSLANDHLLEVDELKVVAPVKEVSLDDLVSWATTEDAKWHTKAFVARFEGKSQMTGLFSGEEERMRFYRLLSDCLKNCIIALETATEQRMLVIETILELEKQEQHCAGRYFGVLTKLFRTIAKQKVNDFEKKVQIMLAEHREELLSRCLDPLKTNTYNEYNYVLAQIGREFGLPGIETCEHYKSTSGLCDLDAVRKRFWQLYTPESIIKKCIEPALNANPSLKDAFCSWLTEKMPGNWGVAVSTHFAELRDASREEKLEFLHKNGVVVQEGQENYEEAIEATRKAEYLKREVFHEGAIKSQAIARMLAGLNHPVVDSTRLEHEESPTTFASKWLKKILDLV